MNSKEKAQVVELLPSMLKSRILVHPLLFLMRNLLLVFFFMTTTPVFSAPEKIVADVCVYGGVSGGVTAASNQAGTQRVSLPDAAAVDTSISVFEIVDPRVCLPADQREDEDKGCAKGGGN